jgi:CPA2 family monovalent cation:H+ antiporter-2
MLRSLSGDATATSKIENYIPDFKITHLKVHRSCAAAGKGLTELGLRKRFRVSILAIRRGKELILNPGGDDFLYPDDDIIVSGQMGCIIDIIPLLRPCETGTPAENLPDI